MAPIVERVEAIPNLLLGEGPHWDEETQSLYFTNIMGKSIHKYTPSTGRHTKATFDKPVSIIIPVKDKPVSIIIPVKGKPNQFIITLEREVNIITWDGQSEKVSKIEKIAVVDHGTGNRINDGKCDPSGRLWFGTMGPEVTNLHIEPEKGTLFSLSNGKTTKYFTKVGISNGLAWNVKLKQMYYIDSFAGSVDAIDFDIENGTVSNRRPIFTLSKHDINGLPDGMTIDVDGNLWVAIFNASRVVKIDPRKPETILQTVEFPAKQITSVAWGDKDLSALYVTSASFTVDGVELLPPNHGAIFKVTGLGTRGFSGDSFVLTS